jgi:hypothetical protein
MAEFLASAQPNGNQFQAPTSLRSLAMRLPGESWHGLSVERETGFEPATLSLGS